MISFERVSGGRVGVNAEEVSHVESTERGVRITLRNGTSHVVAGDFTEVVARLGGREEDVGEVDVQE